MSIYPTSYKSLEKFVYLDDLPLKRSIIAVKTRRGEDAKYIVGDHYRAKVQILRNNGKRYWHCICVPKGYRTDLVSVPWIGRAVVSRAGPYLEACIFHDWLYEAWIALQLQPKEYMKTFADDVVRVAMEAAKVGKIKRGIISTAVKRYGGREFQKAKKHKIVIPNINNIIDLPAAGPERDKAIKYLKECVCCPCDDENKGDKNSCGDEQGAR